MWVVTPCSGVIAITAWYHNPEEQKLNTHGLCFLVGEAPSVYVWVPLTMARLILGLQMDDTVSRCGK
jgi:hypothetical protein